MTDDRKPDGGDDSSAAASTAGATPEAAAGAQKLTTADAIEVARAAAAEAAAKEAEEAEATAAVGSDDADNRGAGDDTDSAGDAVDKAEDSGSGSRGTGSGGGTDIARDAAQASTSDNKTRESSGAAVPTPADVPATTVSANAPPAPSPAPPPAPVQATASPPPQRSGATPVAWLALILVLLIGAGGFMQLLDLQRREASILQRVQGLESTSGQDTETFDQMRDNLMRQIELELEGIESRQQRAEEDQQRAAQRLAADVTQRSGTIRNELDGELASLRSALQAQENQLSLQQQRLSDLSVEDRKAWQIAEVQYLLRLANQRLIMTGDTLSAEALLRSADNILRELADPNLHGLREAVASDTAAVRAVPRLDMQGLYLRLEALIRQTDALVLFELPTRSEAAALEPAETWQSRLTQGFDAAVTKLSEYIVVSRRDVPVETLMDPQYEGLVRQNMRMLLEQAQVAMLSGNERLYRQSLERAEGWVTQFFKADQQAAQAMTEELRRLRDERIAVVLPDLTASLNALSEAMKARLAASGA
ncbi:MAG: uroporphyrinogen-III C-methyltransferase [Pseudomonadota bacterium]